MWSGMFIPGPDHDFYPSLIPDPGVKKTLDSRSASASTNLSIFNPKNCFYVLGNIRDVDPGSWFFYPYRIQGSKRHRITDPGSRTDTLLKTQIFLIVFLGMSCVILFRFPRRRGWFRKVSMVWAGFNSMLFSLSFLILPLLFYRRGPFGVGGKASQLPPGHIPAPLHWPGPRLRHFPHSHITAANPAPLAPVLETNLFHMLQPVLRFHDILVWIRIRISGSMPLTNGSGSRRPKNRIRNTGCNNLFTLSCVSFTVKSSSLNERSTNEIKIDLDSLFYLVCLQICRSSC